MIGLIISIAILAVIAFTLIGIYNSLVQLRVRADNAWADIDVQLKRRYDLIPNLVETVKGYAAHEKGTFENVAKFRSAAMAATLRRRRARRKVSSPTPCADCWRWPRLIRSCAPQSSSSRCRAR